MRSGAGVLCAIAAALAGAGCGSATKTVTKQVTTTTPSPATTTPAPVSAAVPPDRALERLLKRTETDQSFRTTGFKRGAFVTAFFISKVKKAEADARAHGIPGLDFDPFFCAQALPRRSTYDAPTASGESVTVVAHQDFGGPKLREQAYVMRLDTGVWKLDSNECIK
jgi:hypothetical protein